MKQLSVGAFEKSERFIKVYGRPLEVARFNYAFNGASHEKVLDGLELFQNPDGGYGRALEPDLRAPASSVLCTSVAFQTLRALDVSSEISLVRDALDFLVSQFNEDELSWRIVPPEADAFPRAPWWFQEGRVKELGQFALNPTAEILGYFYEFEGHFSAPLLEQISERVVSEILSRDSIEMHDLLCCLRLLKSKNLPDEFCNPIQSKLGELIQATVCCDPAGWSTYSLRPLQVVEGPNDPFAKELEAGVAQNLDYEIELQADDGSWGPTWTWDDQYPNEWEIAKQEWSGFLTLEKLMTLKRFGRITQPG